MDFFSNPPEGVTKEEFKRIMGDTHHLPDDVRKRVEDLAESYFTRPGIYNRIRKEDFPQFMKAVSDMIPSMYHDQLPELQSRLQKAVEGHYGF